MKLSAFSVFLAPLLASLVSPTWAFPSLHKLNAQQQDMMADMVKRGPFSSDEWKSRQLYIPTIGRKKLPDADHPFIAPSKSAQRGPCPGLNLLANHGYLNREGITDFFEMLYALQEGMAWSLDFATIGAAFALVVDGNPLNGKISLGGPDARVGTYPIVGGKNLLPGGLLKHNSYEVDASLTRNDVYPGGDNKNLNGTLYQQIWDVADELNGGKINALVMAQVRSNRYAASARDDPHFTWAPVGAFFYIADQFLWNVMVSADQFGISGESTRETLSPVYGAKRTGERTWEYVPERFPDNWYRRAVPLSTPEALAATAPSVALAALKLQLPIGFTPASFKSAEAFTCAIKDVILGQIPAGILGIDVVNWLVNTLRNVGYSC